MIEFVVKLQKRFSASPSTVAALRTWVDTKINGHEDKYICGYCSQSVNREFANNVFHARIYFPLRYTSLISVCDVIS